MIECFIDTETTGLDHRIHQAYEVAWAIGDDKIEVTPIAHTLEHADPAALGIGRYHDRRFVPNQPPSYEERILGRTLKGVTLIGSNPDFDARMLTRVIGYEPWSHRKVNIATMAMVVFDWPEPLGLKQVTETLEALGYGIPKPDHTARGDVATSRSVYRALRQLRTAHMKVSGVLS